MKKSIMMSVAALLCAATISFAQNNTSSTDKAGSNPHRGQGTQTAGKGKAQPAGQEKSNTASAKDPNAPAVSTTQAPISRENPSGQQAQRSDENDGSNRPGGDTHENANYVGKYSDEADDKSMTHSKEALAIRRKNLTESDTVMKSGSGSAPRNMKNHTGTTGNYRNGDAKHNYRKNR